MMKPRAARVPGQIISEWQHGVLVLHFRRVDWVHNESSKSAPIATLWHPVFGGVGHSHLVVRGLEAVQRGPVRRWTTQKWLCDVLDHRSARDYLQPSKTIGEVPSLIPRGPPPIDPDDPFESGFEVDQRGVVHKKARQ